MLHHHDFLDDERPLHCRRPRQYGEEARRSIDVSDLGVSALYRPGKIIGGTAPIIDPAFTVYSNPLPHVLILTAIVVGVATLALGLALVIRINEAYGTVEEDEIFGQDRDA